MSIADCRFPIANWSVPPLANRQSAFGNWQSPSLVMFQLHEMDQNIAVPFEVGLFVCRVLLRFRLV